MCAGEVWSAGGVERRCTLQGKVFPEGDLLV